MWQMEEARKYYEIYNGLLNYQLAGQITVFSINECVYEQKIRKSL
jgi:hypothetical protein